ncbi:hypothetical protein [Bradymonas sediminis]|uniref:Uncharacterized protein n=2 Tax=Bradymonas sediminis TaxID=1548548 RepID=A0A2Z4FHL7_9DELT|nr:hypothetical protein [Bradymonas sediminis]AWV88245.1 hypothetical protein DN745_02370 [Bradymonas sediminis]
MPLAGCGESAKIVNSNSASESSDTPPDALKNLGDEYVEREQNIVMPWTHQVSEELLAELIVEPGRIIAPLSLDAAQFEHGDVLASVVEDQAFLRKITGVEYAGDQVIYQTRQAAITEAVYKGSLSSSPSSDTMGADGALGSRQQGLSSQVPEYNIQGSKTFSESVSKTFGGVTMEAEPSINVSAQFYFDMEIDADNDVRRTEFQGTQTCSATADCFPNAARGANRAATCNRSSGRCEFTTTRSTGWGWFSSEGASCNDIIASLDFANNNAECRALYDQYYAGNITLDDLLEDGSSWHDWVVDGRTCEGHLPPHPVQVDWAKDHCSGTLKRLVVDGEGTVEPSTGELKIGVERGFDETFNLWDKKKQVASKMFFIGWLPVLITSNVSAKLDLTLKARVDAHATLAPISIQGLRFGSGFHYFASAAHDNGLGVELSNGQFRAFSSHHPEGAKYDAFQPNPERNPNPSIAGLDFTEQTFTASARGTASASIKLAPRIDLMLYGVAGPYLEPFTPYAEIKFDAGGLWSTNGTSETYGTCTESDTVRNLCGRIGAQGKMGLDATTICSNCDWDMDLYDTCSDYCPENPETMCAKTCLGDEPETPGPLSIKVLWADGTSDLDLSLSAPVSVNYRAFSGPVQGYQHSGDICPRESNPDNARCTDEPDADFGAYREEIFVEDAADVLRGAGNEYSINVKTYTAGSGSATFDLIVEADGEEVTSWSSESMAADGQSRNFTFVLP